MVIFPDCLLEVDICAFGWNLTLYKGETAHTSSLLYQPNWETHPANCVPALHWGISNSAEPLLSWLLMRGETCKNCWPFLHSQSFSFTLSFHFLLFYTLFHHLMPSPVSLHHHQPSPSSNAHSRCALFQHLHLTFRTCWFTAKQMEKNIYFSSTLWDKHFSKQIFSEFNHAVFCQGWLSVLLLLKAEWNSKHSIMSVSVIETRQSRPSLYCILYFLSHPLSA